MCTKKNFRMFLHSVTMLMITFISPTLAQTAAPKLSGYLKTSYSVIQDAPSAMTVSNARIKMSGSIDEKTSYVVFFDAIHDDVLLDAYVNRKITSAVDVQAGQFKTPYGDDNLLLGWKYPFINRGYLKSAVAPPFRDIGVQLSAHCKYMEACVGIMNGSGSNKSETNTNKSMTYRMTGILSPLLQVSANYSRCVTTSDGGITEYCDAGACGLCRAISYAGEYGCRKRRGITSSVAAAWLTCDIDTTVGPMSVLTPAVRCEWYDPDADSDSDTVMRYTMGVSVHSGATYANRIMIDYELTDPETGDTGGKAGIEYMVKY